MTDGEIEGALRKKKRSRVLVFNAVKSRHLMDMRAAASKPQTHKPRSTNPGSANPSSTNRESKSRSSGELSTVHAVAEHLKLHRKTVLRFIREGRLQATRVGKSYRIRRSDLEAFAGVSLPTSTLELPSVTSIVDIPGIRPEIARKWQSNISSTLNSRRDVNNAVRADVIYEPERSHLKIVVVGPPSDSVSLLSLIRVWMDQLR